MLGCAPIAPIFSCISLSSSGSMLSMSLGMAHAMSTVNATIRNIGFLASEPRDSPCLCSKYVATDTGFNEYDHQTLMRVHWPESQDRAVLTRWMNEQDNPRRAFQARFEEALRRWQRNEDDYQETWPAFRERVLASLYSLANRLESGDSALVFTSGGAISVAIQHLLELDQEALITFNRGLINTSVTRLLVNTGRLRLATLNEHLHLAGDMLTYR